MKDIKKENVKKIEQNGIASNLNYKSFIERLDCVSKNVKLLKKIKYLPLPISALLTTQLIAIANELSKPGKNLSDGLLNNIVLFEMLTALVLYYDTYLSFYLPNQEKEEKSRRLCLRTKTALAADAAEKEFYESKNFNM